MTNKPRFQSKRLKEGRHKKGLTQEQLAGAVEKLGGHVTVQQLARWEKSGGDKEPKGSTLALLATATGVTVAWLLGECQQCGAPQVKIPALVLSEEETQYVLEYRGANPSTRKLMRECILDALQIAKAMSNGNANGKENGVTSNGNKNGGAGGQTTKSG
jgi:transcriptional regulator with XRE-family HTH domain